MDKMNPTYKARDLRRLAMTQQPIAGRQPGERPAPPLSTPSAELPFYAYRNFTRIASNSDAPTLQENRRRVYLGVQVQGLNNVYVSFGNHGDGLLLAPNGFYELPYHCVNSSVFIYTIAAGVTSSVILIEGVQI